MLRTRFSIALLTALSLGATAHAQSAPASTSARINDIQIARDGETVSILVKLSQQPAAAAAKPTGESLTIDIDGLSLVPLTLAPPAGSLVTKVEAGAKGLTLSGAAFGSATTVIYRNAVLIEAKLAEPDLRAGSSLMAAATPAKPAPAPVAAPTPPAPAATPVAAAANDLQSHPAPAPVVHPKPAPAAPPKPAPAGPTASLAGIDAARCTAAAAELAKDAWALAAMGDHALCLLDTGKADEAKNRLDQLAAITPQDWRVALGRAVLEEKAGDIVKAQASYVAASLAAPNDAIRANIAEKISPTASTDAVPLQLPKPTAVAAH